MKVLILAGGLGTRFGDATADKPKPMIQIGKKPIIWHVMKIFADDGYNSFIILLGYKGDAIKSYFDINPEPEWNIEFIETGDKTLKSQRIKKAENYIHDDYFFVAYGDDVADVCPTKIYEQHIKSDSIATLTAVPLTSDFGIVIADESNKILSFKEKPVIEGYYINGGFFCFSKEIFSYLNNKNEELEDEVFKKLTDEKKISVFHHHGFWKCMNTMKDKLEIEELIINNKALWLKQ